MIFLSLSHELINCTMNVFSVYIEQLKNRILKTKRITYEV